MGPHHCELPDRLGFDKCLQRHFLALSGLTSRAPLVTFMNDPERLPNGHHGPEFGSLGQVVRNVEVENLEPRQATRDDPPKTRGLSDRLLGAQYTLDQTLGEHNALRFGVL